jgi:tRNA pseudouridine32 synthase/23S rRNA pseudouridine746 synthase
VSYAPPTDPLRVLFADDALLAVDKPEGLLSVPGRGPDKADCLISRLGARFDGVYLVHRLDRDTSGVIVFARTPAAQAALGKQFERRETSKTYVARVAGHVQPDAGRVDLPLTVDWPNRPRQMVCHDTGRPAQTDWRVLARGDGETRIALTPITGRSHQLRVHMLALGHPILGDTLYARGAARDHARLMLHAQDLGLRHPVTGAWIDLHAPAPF